MMNFARNLLAVLVFSVAAPHASFALAAILHFGPVDPPQAPEIDPAMAVGALALLAGGMMVIRGRNKLRK